jgi:hypothetical protein
VGAVAVTEVQLAVIGAAPYRLEKERGVEGVNATADCMTRGLDRDPTIERDVVGVDIATASTISHDRVSISSAPRCRYGNQTLAF